MANKKTNYKKKSLTKFYFLMIVFNNYFLNMCLDGLNSTPIYPSNLETGTYDLLIIELIGFKNNT